MTINIAITDSPDTEALADMHSACFAQGWSAASMRELLAVKGTTAFVAQGGFALLRRVGDDAEILTLAVLPQCRKNGIGTALVAAMRDWAQAQGIGAVFLEVRDSNAAAVALYKKAGFSLLSRRKGYYRGEDCTSEDAVVMRAVL